MWFQTVSMLRARLRGPPSRMVRSQDSTSRRIPGGKTVELALQPVFEGRPPIVGQHPHLGEHVGDPLDADAQGPQGREHLGVADGVALGVL